MRPTSPLSDDPFLDAVRAEAGRFTLEVTPGMLEVAAKDLAARIEAQERVSDRVASARLPRYRRWSVVVAATSVLLTLALALGAKGLVARKTLFGKSVATIHTTYTTKFGERATVQLRDGARLTLAPATTLRVHADDRATIVDLVGEAYFDIPHASARPFQVRTGSVTTHVLGTTFDVRRYANDDVTRVAVLGGRVSVGGQRTVVLTQGAVAEVTDSTTAHVSDDASALTSWTTGQLKFHRAPLNDVLTTVGRWYGVRFRLSDSSMTRRHVTAGLDFGSRAELLQALQFILDVTVTYDEPGDGRETLITLHPRSTGAPTQPAWPGRTAPAREKDRNQFTPTKEMGR